MKVYKGIIKKLKPNQIFVFGSKVLAQFMVNLMVYKDNHMRL